MSAVQPHGAAASVRQIERNAQGAVERGDLLRGKRTDVIGERGLRQAHHLVAVNGALMSEPLGGLAVEPSGTPVDDRKVSQVLLLAHERREVAADRSFDKL